MKVLQKRGAAIAVLLFTILLFSPLGIRLSVAREARRIERGFTEGVYLPEEKRTAPSILHHLENCLNAVTGLLSLIPDEPSAQALLTARLELISAMDSGDISAMAAANRNVLSSLEDILPVFGQLSDGKAENAEYYLELFTGAEAAIASDPYHALAESFSERVLGAFPTSLFRNVFRFPSPTPFL